jgi:hypothetical protein
MAHSQVVDGEGLQIWRFDMNILNKQWVGQGPTTPHHRKKTCYKMLAWFLDMDIFFGMT